jgi:DNA-directed RNA polymerase specialized sigma24 family protein
MCTVIAPQFPADERLFSDYQDGDTGAWDVLVSRHRDVLTYYIHSRLPDSEAVDDVVQAVFSRMAARTTPLLPGTWFKSLLFKAAFQLTKQPTDRQGALSPAEAEIIRLIDTDNQTIGAAATTLGVSPVTAQWRYRKARKVLAMV